MFLALMLPCYRYQFLPRCVHDLLVFIFSLTGYKSKVVFSLGQDLSLSSQELLAMEEVYGRMMSQI